MKPHSLILFFLLHLQRCLYAQLTTPDSLYLAAGWQARPAGRLPTGENHRAERIRANRKFRCGKVPGLLNH
ncbi:MAG: hypothetical protein J5I94_15940 [Phaeodactylibacter sp.]|nr:hypothetical protein [Phaeodactylibacter sp.]